MYSYIYVCMHYGKSTNAAGKSSDLPVKPRLNEP